MCTNRKKIKVERTNDIDHIDAARLIVWKTKSEMMINESKLKYLAEILQSINVDGKDAIEKLSERMRVAHLGLSDGGHTLLKRWPGASCISTAIRYVLIQAWPLG